MSDNSLKNVLQDVLSSGKGPSTLNATKRYEAMHAKMHGMPLSDKIVWTRSIRMLAYLVNELEEGAGLIFSNKTNETVARAFRTVQGDFDAKTFGDARSEMRKIQPVAAKLKNVKGIVDRTAQLKD